MQIIIHLLIAIGVFLGFIISIILLLLINTSFEHTLPFLKTTLSLHAITIAFILWTIIILRKKWFSLLIFFLSLFMYIKIIIYTTEYEIKKNSLKKFNIIPKYVHLNFDIFSEFKTPHAIVNKNGKEYYWSFRENDFIFYYESFYKSEAKPCNKKCVDNLIDTIFSNKGK